MNLEHFYDLQIEDQQQYFGKTFFKVGSHNNGDTLWISCVGFINRNIAKIDTGRPGEGSMVVDLTKNVPNFDFPATGLYNLGNSTVYFQRVPRRQSKKGLCPDTASFKLFASILMDSKGRGILSTRELEIFRVRSIQAMFGEAYDFSLADSLTFFKKKRPVSFAINRDFALSLGVESKYLSLWYKQILVGEVPSPKDIKLLPGLFQQEVIDHFLQENIQMSGVA